MKAVVTSFWTMSTKGTRRICGSTRIVYENLSSYYRYYFLILHSPRSPLPARGRNCEVNSHYLHVERMWESDRLVFFVSSHCASCDGSWYAFVFYGSKCARSQCHGSKSSWVLCIEWCVCVCEITVQISMKASDQGTNQPTNHLSHHSVPWTSQ